MEKTYDFLSGEVLAFDKAWSMTSFNLVRTVRNRLSHRLGIRRLKVGHAGTLDPLATGVLIVCTGRATKNIDSLQAKTKEYVATLRLGCTTASFDAEHPIDRLFPTAHITRDAIDETLERFHGTIQQVPPTYSACKVDGKRAFSYMREGEEVELKAKELVIDKLEVLDLHLPEQGILSPHADEVWKMARQNVSIKAQPADTTAQDDTARLEPETFAYLRIRVVCSKGTYIRALARDIGEALGSGAYLIGLRRTRVGDITLDKCVKAADIEEWVGRIPLAPIPEEYKDLIIQK